MSLTEGRDFAAASTIGARRRQEDDWGTHAGAPTLEEKAGLLAVVADGMGGMPAGDRASSIALRAFLDSYPALHLPVRERLRRALAHANREVGIAVDAAPELDGMGSTLVAALFSADRCEWLSVGDSLLLRCRDGKIERVNPLHIYASVLDERVRCGEMSPDAAAQHPERAVLTSALQGASLEQVSQDSLALSPGDVVILASDGIATLDDEEIAAICAEHAAAGADRIARELIVRIEDAGRRDQDNATVIVVRLGAVSDRDAVAAEGEGAQEREQATAASSQQAQAHLAEEAQDAETAANAATGNRAWAMPAGVFALGLLAGWGAGEALCRSVG